ncbi:MAG: N-acetyltransferase, partial [Novosphingobium sp.]|nr:N-acetyltransferase [Novosphingobium sp.]
MSEGDPLTLRVLRSVSELAAADWDSLTDSANPFVSHAFLSAMEDSGSVGPGTGWSPAPLVMEDGAG